MSFLNFMSRMIEGKPVFDESNGAAEKPQQPQKNEAAATPSSIVKGSDSTFPVAYVKRMKTNFNGSKMEVYAQIVNEWHDEIMLDKITIGGAVRELDSSLRAGEEREFLIYSGPKLQNECHEAQLDYKTQNEGDYFQAIHDVKCTYDGSDKTYGLDEMRLRRPIRDIYG